MNQKSPLVLKLLAHTILNFPKALSKGLRLKLIRKEFDPPKHGLRLTQLLAFVNTISLQAIKEF